MSRREFPNCIENGTECNLRLIKKWTKAEIEEGVLVGICCPVAA